MRWILSIIVAAFLNVPMTGFGAEFQQIVLSDVNTRFSMDSDGILRVGIVNNSNCSVSFFLSNDVFSSYRIRVSEAASGLPAAMTWAGISAKENPPDKGRQIKIHPSEMESHSMDLRKYFQLKEGVAYTVTVSAFLPCPGGTKLCTTRPLAFTLGKDR